jgi:hypothetical protein
MPTVPTYDSLKVGTTATPVTQASAPAYIDQAGTQAQALGKGMLNGGQAIVKHAVEWQAEVNEAKIKALDTQYIDSIRATLDDPENGYMNKRGEEALKARDAAWNGLTDVQAAMGKDLDNDVQRKMWRDISMARLQSALGRVDQHASAQGRQFAMDSATARASKASQLMIDNAAAYSIPGSEYAKARDTMVAELQERARLEGKGGPETDATQQFVLAGTTLAHANVITDLLSREKGDAAKQYFTDNIKEIDPAQRDKLRGMVMEGEAEARAQDKTQELLAKNKGDLTAALAEARATLRGKDEDAVVQRLKAIDAESSIIRERHQKDAADEAWRIYSKTGSFSKIPIALRDKMDGRDVEAIKNAQRMAIEHARGGAAKVNTEERDATFYEIFGDDDAVARLRPEQIADMRRQGFTAGQVGQLMRRKQSLEKDAEAVALDNDQLKEAYDKAGVTDKKTQGRIKSAAEAEVHQDQQRLGRPLDRTEKQKIINRQFLQVDTRHVGTGLFNKGDVSYEAKPYWQVGDKNAIKVPDADRKRIEADLRAMGIRGLSDQQLRDLYLEMKK